MATRGVLWIGLLGAGLFGSSAFGAATGSLVGRISYEGTPPAPVRVPASSDATCRALNPDGFERRLLEVKDGGLANAIVYVKGGLPNASYPPPAEAALLDQEGCNYAPAVVALQVGQTLKIRNSDATFHNVHSLGGQNPAFNVAQPRKGMEAKRVFDKPELLLSVKCDMHPWMRAIISVFPHPFFAVTGPDGSFSIQGLPAGEYEVEAAHERLRPVSGRVTVGEGQSAKLDLSLRE